MSSSPSWKLAAVPLPLALPLSAGSPGKAFSKVENDEDLRIRAAGSSSDSGDLPIEITGKSTERDTFRSLVPVIDRRTEPKLANVLRDSDT